MDLGDQGPPKRRPRGKRGAKDGRGNGGGTSKAFHSSFFLEAGSAADPYARRKELQEERKVMMQRLLKEKPVDPYARRSLSVVPTPAGPRQYLQHGPGAASGPYYWQIADQVHTVA